MLPPVEPSTPVAVIMPLSRAAPIPRFAFTVPLICPVQTRLPSPPPTVTLPDKLPPPESWLRLPDTCTCPAKLPLKFTVETSPKTVRKLVELIPCIKLMLDT